MDKLKESFIQFELKLPGGESSHEAMNRGISVVKELLCRSEQNILIVTHGNMMTLMMKYFDDRYGFDEWISLTNPDVYEIEINKTEIKRVWN